MTSWPIDQRSEYSTREKRRPRVDELVYRTERIGAGSWGRTSGLAD